LLGGGESLGLLVRRGAKDPEPSVILRFTDDKFGMPGGYDAEIFSEQIAIDEDDKGATKKDGRSSLDADGAESPPTTSPSHDDDSLLCRQGIKFSLRGPIPSNVVRQSSASASIERTSTRKGRHESIGSTTLSLGPFVQDLPLGARASLITSATTGARVGDNEGSWRLLPYSRASATSRQIFPLFTDGFTTTSKQVKLALQHTIMAATPHLPHHEANAAGFAARVRGYPGSSNGMIDSSIVGTAEVRIPVSVRIPRVKLQQDASLVFFGDWMFANSKTSPANGFTKDGIFGKSSIGIGLRKSVQGIPLKYDLSLNKDGKIGAFFSLGNDWDI